MKRAIGRAYKRIQGRHPRREKTGNGWLVELGCDLILVGASACALAGVGLAVWAAIAGFLGSAILAVIALFALGAGLLLLWEKIAWEPFVGHLNELT